jgi:hypothetical protein
MEVLRQCNGADPLFHFEPAAAFFATLDILMASTTTTFSTRPQIF